MTRPVIKVERLGKEYAIGREMGHETFREMLVSAAAAPFRRFYRLSGKAAPEERIWALKDVNFEVKEGEVLGVIGRNGAGKSTLLKVLSRITEPTEGRVRIKGRVASLLEVGTGFHPELTGRENIYLNGAILGMTRNEIRKKFDEIVAFAEVQKFLDTPIKRYSSGMYVRLAFAVAAHLEPEILLVDEVLAVGDAEFQRKCMGKIKDVAQAGRTVLFVSHQLATVENLSKTAMLLERGHVKLLGPTSDVIATYVKDGAVLAAPLLLERTDRRGNGLLRFSDICLFDECGAPLKVLFCGKSAVIELRVKNPSAQAVRQLHISIGVHNAFGQRVTTWSTSYAGGDIPVTPAGDFVARLRLPRLSLMPGSYTFYLYAAANGDVVDWLLPGGTFNVEAGDFYGTGKIPENRDAVFISDHEFDLVCSD